jgi:hypothetical protein
MRGSRSLACLALLGALTLPVADAAARDPNLARGSCDGLLDYADELSPDQIELVQEIALGNGLSRIDVRMELHNADLGSDGSLHACDAATLGDGASGAPIGACEFTFVATSGAGLTAGLRPALDGIRSGVGADLSQQVAFVPATVAVPEADALACGLAALACVACLRRRTPVSSR